MAYRKSTEAQAGLKKAKVEIQQAEQRAEQAEQLVADAKVALLSQPVSDPLLTYADRMFLACKEWQAGNSPRAKALLDSCSPGQRNLEWYHLMHRILPGDANPAIRIIHPGKPGVDHFTGKANPFSFSALPEVPSNLLNHGAYSSDGSRLAAAFANGTIKLWNTQTGAEQATLTGHKGPVNYVAFSPDGQMLASASWDSTVKLWMVATGKEIATLSGHKDGVIHLAFSPAGDELASASWDRTIGIWDIRKAGLITSLRGHLAGINYVVYSPNGQYLASASADGVIKVWDTVKHNEHATLRGHKSPVLYVNYSPDGTRLTSGSQDGMFKLWDTQAATEVSGLMLKKQIPAGLIDGSIVAVAIFSPDGQKVAVLDEDFNIKLLDARSGKEKSTLKTRLQSGLPEGGMRVTGIPNRSGGADWRAYLTFSPDGKRLVRIDPESTMREVVVWDMESEQQAAFLPTAEPYLFGGLTVAINPNGQQLALIGHTGGPLLTLWDCSRALRSADK
jgi:WD40 repeat protein